ncbi:FIST C-terminal domain-containing protein [Azoarcus sp. L1K30]|uniref:nitric oxide-sensing protein NosP n=1 Tax=Azoarcus sp. L1K30 TaxID=2820277 RepID=UPI001B82F198|nr:nitric oxide-sensing protein NosP [Azoarcus sp. L1K30]MBR0567725.1 FIST C-terminal domain-containing protein [Azoarcus sp. L1K30]
MGHSPATDPEAAAEDFYHSVRQPDAALVVFFCSADYDLEALAAALNKRFVDVPVIGCTTAGEIGPAGYRAGSLSGFSLPSGGFKVAYDLLQGLQDLDIGDARAFARRLLETLDDDGKARAARNTFGFLLIDGLSIREEPVANAIQSELGTLPMFGGSAGDGADFCQTWIFHRGAFHANAALLSLIRTERPFQTFKTQHFIRESERLVVTEADAGRRIVHEINGLPAAQEYARLIGTSVEELSEARFASSPVVVVIDGTDYVRSIQRVNEDGSLTFFSAIEEGLVFRVARGENLVANLEQALESLSAEIGGKPELLIACDCYLRQVEMMQRGDRDAVETLLKRFHAVGFSTYGEQINGIHVNQTLTGIAIGR